MSNFSLHAKTVSIVAAAAIAFSPAICSAQTAETGLKSKPVAIEKASDEKIDVAVKTFFASAFEKDYETAAMYMKTGESADKSVARIEKWREKFMAPSNLKILSKKRNADGTVAAVVTFQYKNANGVADIMREKVTVSAGDIPKIAMIESFDKKEAAKPQPVQISSGTAPAAGGSSDTGIDGLIDSMGGGGNGGGSAPNITGIISAIGSGGGGNIDPGTLMNLVTEMANDPEVLELATNPKIMAIAQDSSVMNLLLSGNMNAISKDPRVKELLSDPAVQKLINKMKNKTGGSKSQPSSSTTDIDKLFE